MKARLARASLLLLAAAHPGCNQALLTAPPGATLQIFANPTFIAANGDVSVISVLVIEPAGTPVPDGTVVQFFTNLGRIDEQGRTNDGVARVNLVSDRRSGTATVTAVSGGDGASETTVDVEIGSSSARPARVFVTADPPRIVSPRFTTIVATVFDEDGNPVANVPVVFTVESDTGDATESMQSGSAAIFTDNNGQARDELLTSYPPDEPTKSVEVMATLLAGTEISDSTTVQIN